MYSVVVGAWALKTRGILLLDLHDVDLSRNKRQSESDSIKWSTTFCSDDFIQNIFKIDVAIVEISISMTYLSNGGKIIKAKSIFNKRCCRVLFVIGRIDYNKCWRSNLGRIHFRAKRPHNLDVLVKIIVTLKWMMLYSRCNVKEKSLPKSHLECLLLMLAG